MEDSVSSKHNETEISGNSDDGKSATNGPEFVAFVLCGSSGARMFPLTSSPASTLDAQHDAGSVGADDDEDSMMSSSSGDDENLSMKPTMDDGSDDGKGGEGQQAGSDSHDEKTVPYQPKHLLPIAGVPIICRLVQDLIQSGFEECVIACSHLDEGVTLKEIQKLKDCVTLPSSPDNDDIAVLSLQKKIKITFVNLPPKCNGSGDALRHVTSNTSVISLSSHVILVPSDLVLIDFNQSNQGSGKGGNTKKKNSAPNSKTATILGSLANAHRKSYEEQNAAVTMLLVDVGEEDEQGLPLKESAKQKKGGFSRDEEDIEYFGLASISSTNTDSFQTTTSRVILKRSKIEVEENEENEAATPVLNLPKHFFRYSHNAMTRITTDLCDLHVYAIAPWVRILLQYKKSFVSFNSDLVPFLISRSFHQSTSSNNSHSNKNMDNDHNNDGDTNGNNNNDPADDDNGSIAVKNRLNTQKMNSMMELVFGKAFLEKHPECREELDALFSHENKMKASLNSLYHYDSLLQQFASTNLNNGMNPHRSKGFGSIFMHSSIAGGKINTTLQRKRRSATRRGDSQNNDKDGFICAAHVLPRTNTAESNIIALRASNIPSYLHSCREILAKYSTIAANASSGITTKPFPDKCQFQSKNNSLLLPNSSVGKKLKIQNSTIGSNCKIGLDCRLNNVVLLNNVVVGDGSKLQNCILGNGVVLEANCSLNDCQVGHGVTVSKGTKLKGEIITS